MISKSQCIEWIAALRSDEFKQGRGKLYNKEDDSYCCLGVLAKINNLPIRGVALNWEEHSSIWLYPSENDESESCNGDFYSMEIPSMSIPLNESFTITLAGMNDRNVSFEEIADHLEKYFLPLLSD